MRVFFGVERQIVGVQGTMCNRIASSEPQWVVAKSEVNNEVIFSFIGYGEVSLQFGELTTDSRGSTSRDQPGRQVGRDECCQGIVLHDRAGQALMKTGEARSPASNTASWWSTLRDYPAFNEGFMKTGEVINPRCSENRGSAAQHF